MKRGVMTTVTVERLAPDGSGIAHSGDVEFVIPGALPGDELDVQIRRIKNGSALCRIDTVRSHGVLRIDPLCPHFTVCGGCKWQDVPYAVQCELKAAMIHEALAGFGGREVYPDAAVVASPDEYYYRNKMEFSFDAPPRLEGRVFAGLHEAGKFNRVFDVTGCRLQLPASNAILETLREIIARVGLTAYGLKSHKGLLRYCVVRDGKHTGDVMVNIVTSGDDFPAAGECVDALRNAVPELTTVLRTINRSRSAVATGEERKVLWGGGTITDRIGRREFVISPESFFQTNTRQAEKLYDTIGEFAGLTGTERVLDLYCGAGTIGLYLAENAGAVIGIELVGNAVRDARVNAEKNGVGNAEFYEGKVEDALDDSLGCFDVVICDPPRPGLHPKAFAPLLALKAPRIVYVSCNSKVLPCDLSSLIAGGYEIERVRAFDMSPHTPHVETVVALSRCK